MQITPNYDEVEEGEGFAAIESGAYPAIITEVKPGSDMDGHQAVTVVYKITGSQYGNRLVWQNNISAAGPNAWRFKKWTKGILGEEVKAGTAVDMEAFLGREVTLVVDKAMSKDGTKAFANVKSVTKR